MPSDLIRAGIFETASGIYRHDQMTRNLIRSIRSDFLQNFEIKARPDRWILTSSHPESPRLYLTLFTTFYSMKVSVVLSSSSAICG